MYATIYLYFRFKLFFDVLTKKKETLNIDNVVFDFFFLKNGLATFSLNF